MKEKFLVAIYKADEVSRQYFEDFISAKNEYDSQLESLIYQTAEKENLSSLGLLEYKHSIGEMADQDYLVSAQDPNNDWVIYLEKIDNINMFKGLEKCLNQYKIKNTSQLSFYLECLKIIVSKEVNIPLLKKVKDLDKYNENWDVYDLDQEEFDLMNDLLKEGIE